ncbi:MAG: hypothetical protein ACKO6N_15715 [Myxococcota bacterium]
MFQHLHISVSRGMFGSAVRLKWAVLVGGGLLSGQLMGCDELSDCRGEEEVYPVMVKAEPSFTYSELVEATAPPVNVGPEDGGKRVIQAWDCIDVNWWAPVPPMKIVMVKSDLNECELFERIQVETYACYSQEGSDRPYRDYDLDGLAPYEGDCDDADPMVQALDEDGDGLNDCLPGDIIEEETSPTPEPESSPTSTPDSTPDSTPTPGPDSTPTPGPESSPTSTPDGTPDSTPTPGP